MNPLYKFWSDSLAGLNPPMSADDPKAGFYRVKRGASWVPVAVWPLPGTALIEPGLGFKIGREIVDAATGIAQWHWYAANPITEAEYRRVAEQGLDWSDADPVVAAMIAKPREITPQQIAGKINAGQPLDPEESARLDQAFADHAAAKKTDPADELREQITTALGGVQAYAKISSEDVSAAGAGLRNMLLKLSATAKKDGEADYGPHYRAYKEKYDKWNPLVKLAKDGADKIARALERYEDDKREAARAAAARAEAERVRLEQERIAATIQAQIDGEPDPEPVAPPTVQSNMAAPAAQVRPTFGRAASVGTKRVVTAIDIDKVFAALREKPEMRELLMVLAQKYVTAGITVDGATIEERSAIK